jgi:hypothetical protein
LLSQPCAGIETDGKETEKTDDKETENCSDACSLAEVDDYTFPGTFGW